MKKIFITIIYLSLLNIFFLYTQTHKWKVVFELNYGESKYDLGIQKDKYFYHSAWAFAFDKNNYFYIGDILKDRILVYDNYFQFVKEIKCIEPGLLKENHRMLIDDDLNIICLKYNTFFKIDQNGNLIYTTKENVLPKDYYNYENLVMFKNFLTGMLFPNEGDGLIVIGENGERLTNNEVNLLRNDLLKDLNLFTNDEKSKMIFENGYTIDYDEIKRKIKGINALIDSNGKIYSPDKKYHEQFAEIRREIAYKTKLLSEQDISDYPLIYKFSPIMQHIEKYGLYYFGMDSKQNSYWSNRYDRITWYDKYGKFYGFFIPIKHFREENDMFNLALMGNDDHIYFVCLDHEKGFRLFRYEKIE